MLSRIAETSAHFPPHRDFSNLTIPELLAARDAWHTPLTNMHNVIGTAIGKYRFRDRDQAGIHPRSRASGPRTLDNSVVREDSFPCVLVLVSEWVKLDGFDDADPRAMRRHHIVP